MATLYLMIGGPASGKSTIRSHKIRPDIPVVDCDEILKTHHNYDPKNILPEVHEWASLESKKEFCKRISEGGSFVYDSTGTNLEKMIYFINLAHSVGMKVKIIYVRCSLQEALKRNQARERTVPEHVLREKYSTINIAFDVLSGYADAAEVVNN